MTADNNTIDQLLLLSAAGDANARDEVVTRLYSTLHRIAVRQMSGERNALTLSATALVNEAFVHLLGRATKSPANKSHFVALATTAMRHVLIEYARKRNAQKRPSSSARVELSECNEALAGDVGILEIDEALQGLQKLDPELAKLVELKFFGGCNIDELAAAMNQSPATVVRNWRIARAWLRREISLEGSVDETT